MMNSNISNEADENYSMISVKMFPDHRVMELKKEFRISPVFEKHLVEVLSALEKADDKCNKLEEDQLVCDGGYESCNHDDYLMMSDECQIVKSEQIGEAKYGRD